MFWWIFRLDRFTTCENNNNHIFCLNLVSLYYFSLHHLQLSHLVLFKLCQLVTRHWKMCYNEDITITVPLFTHQNIVDKWRKRRQISWIFCCSCKIVLLMVVLQQLDPKKSIPDLLLSLWPAAWKLSSSASACLLLLYDAIHTGESWSAPLKQFWAGKNYAVQVDFSMEELL